MCAVPPAPAGLRRAGPGPCVRIYVKLPPNRRRGRGCAYGADNGASLRVWGLAHRGVWWGVANTRTADAEGAVRPNSSLAT